MTTVDHVDAPDVDHDPSTAPAPPGVTEAPVAEAPPIPATATPSELQADARRAWLANPALTGAELAARFGRGERWGRDRIAEARTNGTTGNRPDAGTAPAATNIPTGGTNGTGTDTDRHPDGTTGVAVPAGPADNGTPGGAVPAAPAPSGTERQTSAAATEQPAPLALVVVTVLAVAIVALVTMFASYSHTMDLAEMAGQAPFVAAILPAAVDGLVIAGSTSLLVDHHLGRKGSPLAWAAVALGLVSSMAANVVSVDPTIVDLRHVKWVMAAYAPLALAVSGHLLLRMLGQRH